MPLTEKTNLIYYSSHFLKMIPHLIVADHRSCCLHTYFSYFRSFVTAIATSWGDTPLMHFAAP